MIALESILRVDFGQPLGDEDGVLFAEAGRPEHGGADAQGLGFEIAEEGAVAVVTGDLLQVESLHADGEGLGKSLMRDGVDVDLLVGLVVGVVVLGVVDPAEVDGDILPLFFMFS